MFKLNMVSIQFLFCVKYFKRPSGFRFYIAIAQQILTTKVKTFDLKGRRLTKVLVRIAFYTAYLDKLIIFVGTF